jgi:NAD(P)-dependent dehydrogenase (short-subunit alcohol dehydrogenase family)
MSRSDSSPPPPPPDYPGLLRLDGRRIAVLGAGQGIGRQTAHALAAVGAGVACVDLDADRARDVADEVDGAPVVGDMTQRVDAERIFAEAGGALGGLDGVVDIIGMSRYAALVDLSDEEWDWHFDIVLRHAYLAAQLGGRVLSAGGGGTMVFVASVSGISSAPRHAAYGAAKAGLMSLVRTAAVELGPAGVRVNAVAPGVVWTPRVSAFLGEEGRARNDANTPLRRVATPADIAAAILFLSCDLSAFVTGQTLVVDGGVGAKFPYPMADELATQHPTETPT